MSTAGGIFAGFLALTALETVSQSQSAGRLGSLFTAAANVIDRISNPAIPLIPDPTGKDAATAGASVGLDGGSSSSSSSGSSSSTSSNYSGGAVSQLINRPSTGLTSPASGAVQQLT